MAAAGNDDNHRLPMNCRYQNYVSLQQTELRGIPRIRKLVRFCRPSKVSPMLHNTEESLPHNTDTNAAGLGAGAGRTPMSTTAHLLSLLEPDDVQNFSSSNAKVLKNSKQTFQLFGSNGIKIVGEILLSNGWIEAASEDNLARLIWSDNLMHFNIWHFHEGHQLFNHVPNVHLLSNKISLLRYLQDYSVLKKSRTGLRMSEFVPETYRLDLKSDRILYCQQHKPGELWICKPATLNQGKGIFLVKSSSELGARLKRLEEEESEHCHFSKPMNVRLIQKYISCPLLLNGRKADIRAYMLLACVRPFVVLFHEGYVRLSCNPFDLDSLDPLTHLTNQCMQRKSPLYQIMKEETVWDMERFKNHVASSHVTKYTSTSGNRTQTSLQNQMCRIMLYCFHAVKAKLERRVGLFELLGFDFLVDTSLKVWLLEINTNSSLQMNCVVLQKVIPTVIEEAIDISVECFEKCRRGVRILPLQSARTSVLLYCEEMPYMKTIPKPTPPWLKKR